MKTRGHFEVVLIVAVAILFTLAESAAQQWRWQRDDLFLNPSGVDLKNAISWAWGDLDKDGYSDILVVNGGEYIESELVAYRGLGATMPPYWIEDSDLISAQITGKGVTLTDLDDDGNLDIVARTADQDNDAQLVLWKKNVSGSWTTDEAVFVGLRFTPSIYYFVNDPCFADVDNDNDLDMIIGDGSDFGDSGIRFFENVGSAATPFWQEDSTRLQEVYSNPWGYNTWSPALMDLNGDELLDLLVVFDIEGYVNIALYPAVASDRGILWASAIETVFFNYDVGIFKILPFDFNRDGIDDLTILESGTGRLYLKQDSKLDENYFRIGQLFYQVSASALPLDYNDDRVTDILAFGHFAGFVGNYTVIQSYQINELLGMRLWRDTHWFQLPRGFYDVFQLKAQLTDIDQNGEMDFVASVNGPFPNYSEFTAFENPDPNFQKVWEPRDQLIAPFFSPPSVKNDTTYYDPSFADLDRDGDPDLLLIEKIFTGTDSGRARYRFFENQVVDDDIRWQERPSWLSGLSGNVFYASSFSDLDLDGDFDLIFGTTEGPLKFYRNTGTFGAPSWQFVAEAFSDVDIEENTTPSFADFDDDNKPDLIVSSGQYPTELLFFRNQSVVAVEQNPNELPRQFTLHQNYPNPFNPETTIEYELAQPGHVRLTIYNLLGQRVQTLVDSWQPAGPYRINWDGGGERGARSVSSGVYVYELKIGETVLRKKMVLLH